jgi:hypothetical protein
MLQTATSKEQTDWQTFPKNKRQSEYNNPQQLRAKYDQPFQRWEIDLGLHASPVQAFCANSFKSGRPTGPLNFFFRMAEI